MTRDEKIAEARRLRGEGMGYRSIAGVIDVPRSTVRRWLDEEAAERERQAARDWKRRNGEHVRAYDADYDREHRGSCVRCGGLMGVGYSADGVCQGCRSAARDERCELIRKWWADGVSHAEIARRLGWSTTQLGVEKSRMREEGIDLPYREGYPRPRKSVPA